MTRPDCGVVITRSCLKVPASSISVSSAVSWSLRSVYIVKSFGRERTSCRWRDLNAVYELRPRPRQEVGADGAGQGQARWVRVRSGQVGCRRGGAGSGGAGQASGVLQSSTTLPAVPALAISKPRSHWAAGSTSVMVRVIAVRSVCEVLSIADIVFQVSYISRP